MQTTATSEKSKSSSAIALHKNKPKPFFAPVKVQPKLIIGAVDDPFEREADTMADHVMRMPVQQKSTSNSDSSQTSFFSPKPITTLNIQRECATCEKEKLKRKEEKPEEEEKLIHRKEKSFDRGLNNIDNTVQRKCTECEEEEKLQMKSVGNASAGMEAPSIVHNVINSGGQPLDAGTRNFFEPRFGYDFSNVKIHTGSKAAESSQSINAHAYTSGNSIVFNKGKYNPHTESGKRLLAHELTHVVQQNPMSPVQFVIQRNMDSDDFKRGYKDGLNGRDENPGPLANDALSDYIDGFSKGYNEFGHNSFSGTTTVPVTSNRMPHLNNQKVNRSVYFDQQYRAWLMEQNWSLAAENLNELSSEEIKKRLAELTPAQIASLHWGAMLNIHLGSESYVAKMTSGDKNSDEWGKIKETGLDIAKDKIVVLIFEQIGKRLFNAAKFGGIVGWAIDFAISEGGDTALHSHYVYRASVKISEWNFLPVGDWHLKRDNAEKDIQTYNEQSDEKAEVQVGISEGKDDQD